MIAVVITLSVAVGVAWATGDWSAAQSKATEFAERYKDLRKLAPDETRSLVKAVCDADDGA
ncbi:MAG TPA: hypothetical protein VHZ95_20755, partial [Polyangiales bacterium]|nr:hypothetical protein [Polyangiales bacterium]